jgi:4-amino-4-deoxy-L-arabinose transferase-like glycosyltransferase
MSDYNDMSQKYLRPNKILVKHKYSLIAILLLINLFTGWLTVRDYGASWDDPKRYVYATNSLKAYFGKAGDIVDDKGPFFVMSARLGTEIIVRLFKGWQTMEAWHWMNFLAFQLGILSLYALCLRLMQPWAAWSAALLFSTQPLLWGHSFINSKDIPFTSFFLLSIVVGLRMIDTFPDAPARQSFTWVNGKWLEKVKSLLLRLKGLLSQKWIWFTGILWGVTTSIRVLGPAAGVLLAIYFIAKSRRKAIPPLLVCFVIAGVVTYLTWPGLWASPFTNFIQSFSESSDFPWQGKVLFNWVGYPPDGLPRSYLPTLLIYQLSIPLLVTFAAGLLVSFFKSIHKTIDRDLFLMLLGWFFIPFLGVIVFRPNLYDNFRHFFFILPPILVFAGIGIQYLFDWLKQPIFYLLVIMLLVAPNIYWIVRLHPYEYTYYNILTGGVGGAFRRFETDYWATSYRDVIQYLNRTAPQKSVIIVWGPANVVAYYARQDLNIVEYSKKVKLDKNTNTYAILSTREESDLKLYSHSPEIYQVGKAGAIFAVAKQLTP